MPRLPSREMSVSRCSPGLRQLTYLAGGAGSFPWATPSTLSPTTRSPATSAGCWVNKGETTGVFNAEGAESNGVAQRREEMNHRVHRGHGGAERRESLLLSCSIHSQNLCALCVLRGEISLLLCVTRRPRR